MPTKNKTPTPYAAFFADPSGPRGCRGEGWRPAQRGAFRMIFGSALVAWLERCLSHVDADVVALVEEA